MKVILFGGSGGVGKAIKQQLDIGLHTVYEVSRGPALSCSSEEVFDVFIYCAGVGYFYSNIVDERGEMMSANLLEPIALATNVKAKHYIFIASNSAYSGFEGSEVYCATKHGILGFARALRKSGKKVSVVSPGAIDTDFWIDSNRPLPELHMQPEDVADAVMACIDNKACIEELLIMPQRRELSD